MVQRALPHHCGQLRTSKRETSMDFACCLECRKSIDLGARPHEGQRLICTECGAHLEVISLKPLELDWVYDGELFKDDFGVRTIFSRGRVGSHF
jgi:lysine biosynthesis protein LysW